MKLNKFFSAIMLTAAVCFAGCSTTNIPDVDDDNKTDDPSVVQPGETPDIDIPEGTLTVAEARAICAELASGETTDEKYYVKGYVKKFQAKHESGMAEYGNATFFMVDELTDSNDFEAYQVYGKNGQKFTSLDEIAVGDYVVVYGQLTNYNGTYETVGKGAAYVYSSSNPNFGKGSTGTPETPQVGDKGSETDPFTATEIIELNNALTGNYFVKAYIVGQVAGGATSMTESTAEFVAPFTGNDSGVNTNILIADAQGETNLANIVPVQLPSGMRDFSLPAQPENLGKEILIYGSLEKYFGAAGIKTITYVKIDDKEYGTKPNGSTTTDAILNETLLTEASFNKFTVVSVIGELTWVFDSKYGAKMSGFANNATSENEDWFISPAMDLTGKDAVVTFDHARGPAGSMSVATAGHYTLWVSNDFNGTDATAIQAATWTELTIPTHGTTAWGYVSSGEIAIPVANQAANCRLAWKYVCDNKESATWEIKNVVVK